jgi:hypothetical protein
LFPREPFKKGQICDLIGQIQRLLLFFFNIAGYPKAGAPTTAPLWSPDQKMATLPLRTMHVDIILLVH